MGNFDPVTPPQGPEDISNIGKTADQQKNISQALTSYILANMLHEHVQQQLQASSSSSILGGMKGGVGAALPLPPLPPDTPPGPFDASVPSDAVGTFGNSGYVDKLAQMLQDLYGSRGSDQSTLQTFLQFIINCQSQPPGNPAINDPRFKALLDSSGVVNLLFSSIQQELAISFFTNGGEAGTADLMQKMRAMLQGLPSNPYNQAMLDGLNSFNLAGFAQEHAGGKWTIDGYDFNWNDADGREIITQYLFNLGPKGIAPNSFYNAFNINVFNHNYRMEAFDQLIQGKTPDQVMIIFCLKFMSTQDDTIQRQEQGLAGTTNQLTNMTNKYATPLLNIIQGLGPNFSPGDASKFAKLYSQATILINSQGQISSLASGWNSGTVGEINGIFVKDPTNPERNVSLGFLIQGVNNGTVTPDTLATAMQSLVPPAPTPDGGSSTSPNYQTLLTALQQGGGLVTGMSKTVSTQLSTLASIDDAILKFGHTVADSTGGGLSQLLGTFVKNQVSR